MIYKDSQAYDDSPRYPAEREGEKCVHCGEAWEAHHGWACDPWYDGVTRFEDLRAECRYLTQSMKDSITPYRPVKDILREKLGPSPTAVRVSADLSDWRTWAHKEPGDCACGIKRTMCDYHR